MKNGKTKAPEFGNINYAVVACGNQDLVWEWIEEGLLLREMKNVRNVESRHGEK